MHVQVQGIREAELLLHNQLVYTGHSKPV